MLQLENLRTQSNPNGSVLRGGWSSRVPAVLELSVSLFLPVSSVSRSPCLSALERAGLRALELSSKKTFRNVITRWYAMSPVLFACAFWRPNGISARLFPTEVFVGSDISTLRQQAACERVRRMQLRRGIYVPRPDYRRVPAASDCARAPYSMPNDNAGCTARRWIRLLAATGIQRSDKSLRAAHGQQKLARHGTRPCLCGT